MNKETKITNRGAKVEQADGQGGTKNHRFLKKRKVRVERRRAKVNPECTPGYGKYRGYEM